MTRAFWIVCALAVGAGRADASEYTDGGEPAVATPPERVSTPLVMIGAGTGLDGAVASATIGWAWGEHDLGLFEGSEVTRILVDTTLNRSASSAAVTFGWYRTAFLDLGFDGGVEARRDAVGPTTRITLGVHGVGARFAAAALFSGEPVAMAASVELIVDVMELAGRL